MQTGFYTNEKYRKVYAPKHLNTVETDFDGTSKDFVWCDRKVFPYEEIKRQAEYALWQKYADKNWIAVRYPFALGKDDYTKRLLFYVEHTMKSIPMHINNLDCQMGYIRSDEAGKFLAFLADKEVKGAINGSCEGTISIKEIIDYVEKKTGTKAVIDREDEAAPYNGEPEYSINTDKAKAPARCLACLLPVLLSKEQFPANSPSTNAIIKSLLSVYRIRIGKAYVKKAIDRNKESWF